MKIKEISLTNFGKYEKVSASFDPNVTYLVGPNGAGKSTLGFTGVQFMFEGIAEKASKGNAPVIGERFRFIHGDARSAKGEMTLVDESTGQEVKVIRSMTKDGNTVRFEGPPGMRLDQAWLTDLFSEFMIAPKKFIQLTPFEQAKALGIDTATFDANIKSLKAEYTIINRDITALGTKDPVDKVDKVDLVELSNQKAEERKRLNDLYVENLDKNAKLKKEYDEAIESWTKKLAGHNADISKASDKADQAMISIQNFCGALDLDLQTFSEGSIQDLMLAYLSFYKTTIKKALTPEQIEKFTPKVPEYIEPLPDDATLQEIDKKIFEASETNAKAAKYEEYLKYEARKEELSVLLSDNKTHQNQEAEARLSYIKQFKFPFQNLTVDQDGCLMFDGRPVKEPYFSTGELIKMVPILFSTIGSPLKSIFIQDFNLLDDVRQQEVETFLTDAGYQLIIEYVGHTEVPGKNCIVLESNRIVNE